MGWNEERSRQRVKDSDFHDFEVDVQDLRRTMDFRNLGTKDVRRAEGVHLYVDVPGFHGAVADAGNDKQKQKKLVRAASVLRKVQRDLMDADDDRRHPASDRPAARPRLQALRPRRRVQRR